CGFDTADGFARAFRLYFGAPPTPWRQPGEAAESVAAVGHPPSPPPSPPPPPPPRTWAVRVEPPPDIRVADTRRVGGYGRANSAHAINVQPNARPVWPSSARSGPAGGRFHAAAGRGRPAWARRPPRLPRGRSTLRRLPPTPTPR